MKITKGDASDIMTKREWFEAFCEEREKNQAMVTAIHCFILEMNEYDRHTYTIFWAAKLSKLLTEMLPRHRVDTEPASEPKTEGEQA